MTKSIPLLLGLLALSCCSPSNDEIERIKKANRQKKEDRVQRILQFAAKHNADLEWVKTDHLLNYTLQLHKSD